MFLEIRDLQKSYGSGGSRVEVLRGLSLGVEQGAFCVLLGPSGSGKSTRLNMIGGIDVPDSGEIGRLYILSTTVVTLLCLLLSLPVETVIIRFLYYEVMLDMIAGWIPLVFSPLLLVRMFVMGVAVYAVVAAFEFRKVKKVPMEEALKNVE